MAKSTKLVFSLFILVLFFSCGNDDETPTSQFDYSIDLSAVSGDIVLVTNQDSEVLFSGQGFGPGDQAIFERGDNDIIDFTYGRSNGENFFSFNTYRNISPDFELKFDFKQSDLIANQSRIFADRVLEIKNVQGQLVAAPFRNVEVENNTIRLSGHISDQSMIVTVFDESCGRNKSMRINPLDWTLQADDTYFHSVSMEEFEESVEHLISLSHSSNNWIVNASALLEDNSKVTLLHWLTSAQNQKGSQIRIYTTPDLPTLLLSLNVSIGNRYESLDYNREALVKFPSEIDFVKMEPTYENFSPSSYTLSNVEQYDMAEVRYEYNVDNYISRWSVFQVREETLEYTLPTLPAEFLVNDDLVLGAIDQPEAIVAEYYQLERPIGNDGIGENRKATLDCEDYSSSKDADFF